jgi:hypothetical protein
VVAVFRDLLKKNLLWWNGVFVGIFEFLVCFAVVNRGEVVVECVANVGCSPPLFGGLKIGQYFELYFWTDPAGGGFVGLWVGSVI